MAIPLVDDGSDAGPATQPLSEGELRKVPMKKKGMKISRISHTTWHSKRSRTVGMMITEVVGGEGFIGAGPSWSKLAACLVGGK